MADVLMIAIMVGFVLLCVAYVGWCDRIIAVDGDPDEVAVTTGAGEGAAEREEVTA